jgi:hypothetical protein
VFLAIQLYKFAQGVFASVPSVLHSVDRVEVTAFFLHAAVIGVIAMALIQVVRGIYPVRGVYHRRAVREWLSTGTSFDDLIRLAVNPNERKRLALALFDLPIEQLCGQIGVMAERVLDDPREHEQLLTGLAGRDQSHDSKQYVHEWKQWRKLADGTKTEQAPLTNTETADSRDRAGEDVSGSTDEQRAHVHYINLRNHLTQSIRRNIDGLQVATGLRWRRYLRLSAIGLAALLSFPVSASIASPNVSQQ